MLFRSSQGCHARNFYGGSSRPPIFLCEDGCLMGDLIVHLGVEFVLFAIGILVLVIA